MIILINRDEGRKLRNATLWQYLSPPGAVLRCHRAVLRCPQQAVNAKLKHALACTIEEFLVFILGFLWPNFPYKFLQPQARIYNFKNIYCNLQYFILELFKFLPSYYRISNLSLSLSLSYRNIQEVSWVPFPVVRLPAEETPPPPLLPDIRRMTCFITVFQSVLKYGDRYLCIRWDTIGNPQPETPESL